jgi:hypothetical protein
MAPRQVVQGFQMAEPDEDIDMEGIGNDIEMDDVDDDIQMEDVDGVC